MCRCPAAMTANIPTPMSGACFPPDGMHGHYDFDAIVIGSGISGGWAAKELTEKGMKVLMLDRGRMVEHRKDYITEGKGPWQLPYRGNLPPAEVERDYHHGQVGRRQPDGADPLLQQ